MDRKLERLCLGRAKSGEQNHEGDPPKTLDRARGRPLGPDPPMSEILEFAGSAVCCCSGAWEWAHSFPCSGQAKAQGTGELL